MNANVNFHIMKLMNIPKTFPLKGLINGQFTKESKIPAVPRWKWHTAGHGYAKVYGVAIPIGFIVIDIDAYKDPSINYIEELEKLAGEPINWAAAWVQDTVSGGGHYLFRIPNGYELYARTLMPNVDTRVGGKSYIATGVGYNTQGKPVENKFDDNKPYLPKKLLDLLGSPADYSQDPISDNNPQNASLITPISYLEASKWMYRVNPKLLNNYDEWISFTLACKRICLYNRDEAEEIQDVWDEVCSQADNYNKEENLKKFKKAVPTSANLETIKRFALQDPDFWIPEELNIGTSRNSIREDILSCRVRKQRKYEIINKFNLSVKDKVSCKADEKEEVPKEVKFDNKYVGDSLLYTKEYIDFVFSKYNISEEGKQVILNFAYDLTVATNQRYYHFISDSYYVKRSVNIVLSSITVSDKDTGEQVNPLTVFEKVVQPIWGVTYNPNKERYFIGEGGLVYGNTYRPVPHKKAPVDLKHGAIERHNRHLEVLFPDKEVHDPFKYQLARIIQRKNATGMAVLIQGAQGCGKTYFKGFFEALLGHRNVKAVDYRKVIDGAFDDWKTGSIVNCLEEVKPEGRYTSYFAERLKEVITAELFSVERKYKPTVTMENFTNYFAFTNHNDAVALEQFDRRWFVMQCAQQTKDEVHQIYKTYGNNYFELLFNDLKESADVLYNYYMKLELPYEEVNRKEAPTSLAKQLLIENNRGCDDIEVEEFILDSINTDDYIRFFLNKSTINLNTLRDNYNLRHATKYGVKQLGFKVLKFILGRLGWKYYGTFRNSKERFTLYYKPDFYKKWNQEFNFPILIPKGDYWNDDVLGKYGIEDKRESVS